MQWMKQLARSVVYWPHIDGNIEKLVQAANHQWMLPENFGVDSIWTTPYFMGTNWLVLVDAYSKYPRIRATTSTSTKATVDILEQEFAHLGYPHTLLTDNAPHLHQTILRNGVGNEVSHTSVELLAIQQQTKLLNVWYNQLSSQ